MTHLDNKPKCAKNIDCRTFRWNSRWLRQLRWKPNVVANNIYGRIAETMEETMSEIIHGDYTTEGNIWEALIKQKVKYCYHSLTSKITWRSNSQTCWVLGNPEMSSREFRLIYFSPQILYWDRWAHSVSNSDSNRLQFNVHSTTSHACGLGFEYLSLDDIWQRHFDLGIICHTSRNGSNRIE